MKYHYVYMLECADATIYVGQTSNLEKRLWQHSKGTDKAAYTFSRRPIKLVWHELAYSREDALALERKLKKWSAAKKRAVIEGRWQDLPELAKCKNHTSHLNSQRRQDEQRAPE